MKRLCSMAILTMALIIGAYTAWAQSGTVPGAAARLQAATAGDRDHAVAQLANVKRLLETSSGATRVLSSDNELARKIRQHALDRYQGAVQAHAAGDESRALELLREATMSMFQAIRVLGPPQEVAQKKIADFEGRAETTRVLLGALQRIATEEATPGTATATVTAVEKAIGAARVLLDEGQYDAARELLDSAYEIAKAAVEHVRDGKTLVRSLTFENAEAEYAYELDRNDTHKILVNVVLEDKGSSQGSQALVAPFLERARDLRRQAEQSAAGRDFREGIRLLESSTKELVRAIRGAGVYIPD